MRHGSKACAVAIVGATMDDIIVKTNDNSLDRFQRDVTPTMAAAEFCSLHYVGRQTKQGILIEKARMRLHNLNKVIDRQYSADHIIAGEFTLGEHELSIFDAINDIIRGVLLCRHGNLVFESNADQKIHLDYDDMHSEGLQSQNRLSVMTLVGGPIYLGALQPHTDWHLRAASQPYSSLQELAYEFQCGLLNNSNVTAEIIADNTLFIDNQSKIVDTSAHLLVRMARQLDPLKVRLGYRMLVAGTVRDRRSVAGTDFHWKETEGILQGSLQVPVQEGAVLQCFASYGGIAKHFYWVANPLTAQNPRRAVFEAFDNDLEILQSFIFREHVKGRDARDFEFAVAWLLWFLGFSVLHLGQTERTRDAPDLIATTSGGDFAVIECTTGLLKADNKLASLVERASRIRKRLVECGSSHLRVLPIIVTSRTRDEVAADLEQAKSLGVVVVTRENITESLGRTLLMPNADEIYKEGIDSVQATEE